MSESANVHPEYFEIPKEEAKDLFDQIERFNLSLQGKIPPNVRPKRPLTPKSGIEDLLDQIVRQIGRLNHNKVLLSELDNPARNRDDLVMILMRIKAANDILEGKIKPVMNKRDIHKDLFGTVLVGTAEDWKIIGKDTNPLLDYFAAEAKGTPVLEQALALVQPLFQIGLARRDMLNTMFRLVAYVKGLGLTNYNANLYAITPAMKQTLGTLPALFRRSRHGKSLNNANLSTFDLLLEEAHPVQWVLDDKYISFQFFNQIVSMNTFPDTKPASIGIGENIPYLQAIIENDAKLQVKDPEVLRAEIDEATEQVNAQIVRITDQVKAKYMESSQYQMWKSDRVKALMDARASADAKAEYMESPQYQTRRTPGASAASAAEAPPIATCKCARDRDQQMWQAAASATEAARTRK
jgi:hypothetical protein